MASRHNHLEKWLEKENLREKNVSDAVTSIITELAGFFVVMVS